MNRWRAIDRCVIVFESCVNLFGIANQIIRPAPSSPAWLELLSVGALVLYFFWWRGSKLALTILIGYFGLGVLGLMLLVFTFIYRHVDVAHDNVAIIYLCFGLNDLLMFGYALVRLKHWP